MVSLYAETPGALPDELATCHAQPAIGPQPAAQPGQLIQRLILRMALTVLVICSAVTVYAHLQPVANAAVAFGLARCTDVPCFRHMTPGRTSWADVRVAYSDPLPNYIALSPSMDGQSLGGIYIHAPTSAHLTIGDIVALYGPPCQVSIVPQYGHWVLHYPLLQAEAFSDSDYLRPDEPVSDLIFRDPTEPAAPCAMGTPIPYIKVIQRSWQGFAVMQRYLDASSEQ